MTIEFDFLNDPVLLTLVGIFIISLLVQLIYFWVVFGKLAFYKKKQTLKAQPPVTVVITAHNQYNDLRQNLPYLLEQDYPEFEIMVVNDNSDDGSGELLTDLSRQYSNLSIVELKQSLNWFSGRKFPLSLGIKSARYDLLILTDTICRPVSKRWIKEIVAIHTPETDIALGYSTFDTKSKINLWFRFSAFYDGLFYLSMALAGKPFKGIGKNLSYTKQLFYNHKGFSSHYKINLGDDEIFINQTANKRNTNIQISQHSKVAVVKSMSFSNWVKSERTRIFIRRFFKTGSRFLISLYHSTAFLFFATFASLLLLKFNWMMVLPLFGLRLISQYIIFGLAAKKLTEKGLLLFSPLLEVFLVFFDFLIWFAMIFSRKKKWA